MLGDKWYFKVKIGHGENTQPGYPACFLVARLIFACQTHLNLKLRAAGM